MTADDILLSKSDLLPAAKGKGEEAETLAGRVFGSVQEAFSSSVNLSAEQRRERAQHNDQLATVTADTLAMLPGLRLPAAGLLRATALVKVSDNFQDMSGNFVKDFAEGAALQKVSSLLLPQGTLGRSLSNKLGNGLLAETATFAATGAGIGVVTTGFRAETWLDQNKKFSLTHGLLEVGKGGTIGGVFGAPAGLIGSKIGKLGFSLANEGRISAGSALFLSGVGGGYLSGATVGGVQGYIYGGDWKSAFRSAGEGGLAGALSGGIGLLGMARLQPVRNPHEETVRASAAAEELPANSSLEKDPQLRSALDQKKLTNLELWQSLEIGQEKLREASLKERVERLGKPMRVNMRYYETAADADAIAASSKTFSEFLSKGGMRQVEGPIDMYSVGGVTISIPEAYARRLDEVLLLRLKAAEDPDLYLKGPVHAREVLQAQLDLEAHPLRNRAHPADFLQLLDELPDRGLVKDLFIREDRSPNDAWTGKEYEKGFRAAASAGEQDKRITFYNGQNRSSLLREYMKHEWAHLLKWAARGDSERFDLAAAQEKDGYYISKYSQKNNDENWAEHTASLLHPDPDVFLQTVHSAPLRSVEMARALMKSLGAAAPNRRGTMQGDIANRINYIQEYIVPEAQEFLLQQLRKGKNPDAIAAAKLLGSIAGPKEFNMLSSMAATHVNPQLREAAFDAARVSLLQRRTHVSGYTQEYTEQHTPEMHRFLVSQAQNGMKSREQALTLLSEFGDLQSKFQHDLLTIDRYEGNKTARAIELMERARDAESLKLAWQTALRIAGKDADGRVNLALRALDRHPRLIKEVVEVFAREGQPRTRPFLRDLMTHYDERVAQRARDGLQKIEMDLRVSELQKTLNTGKENERLSAARALAATKDTRAAGYLLDSLLAASKPEDQAALMTVIRESMNPEIWKFEIRQRRMRQPDLAPKLQSLMSFSPKIS